MTTALAFAPIAIMPGPAGEFVGAIAVSVILAIFAGAVFVVYSERGWAQLNEIIRIPVIVESFSTRSVVHTFFPSWW